MSQMLIRKPIAQTVEFMSPTPSTEEAQRCSNPACAVGPWRVELFSAANSLWRVSNVHQGSYLVAGMTPACPFCGIALTAR